MSVAAQNFCQKISKLLSKLSGKYFPALTQQNRDLGGCSLEQDGVDFYIVGADAVRKKLGETPEYSVLDCGGVDFKEHEFGQWHHGYHFTKVSEIPNFGSMVHGKDLSLKCTMEERTN